LSTQDSNVKIIRNGSSILYNDNPSVTSLPNGSLYLGAYNDNSTASNFSGREQALAYMSDGLTNTEIANLYTAVQTFQTTLSRNV
jgi:DNA-binding NarL/FixJ family response regulator